ncbi:MAG: RICIN domain-containing protein [Clostridia bacterium]|nr:RICIN domain-containing protein [Clostridia bacterium]
MIQNGKRILPLLTVLSLLMTPLMLNVEAVATTEIGNYPQTGRFYMFQNVHSGKFLEVADGNLTAGANVWQDTFNYDSNRAQVFRLLKPETEDIGNGNVNTSPYHQIKPSIDATLRFDVDNANDADGANIKIFSYNPGYGAQSFQFIDNGDGSYRIEPYLSRNSGRVLTVVNASTASKANVVLSSWTEDTSQKWVVKEFELDTYPELIDLGWSYFFHGDAGTTYRRIYQRMHLQGTNTEKWHVGTDFATNGTAGVPFYSPCSGTVIDCGYKSSMGYYVIIKTNATIQTDAGAKHLTIRMMHMNEEALVVQDQAVTSNMKIGYVGYLGSGSTGYHLHVDVNSGNHKWGENIRADSESLINVEKMFLSKRFRYGSINDYIYATDEVY